MTGKKVQRKPPSLKEIFAVLKDVCENNEAEILDELVELMPRLIEAVIEAQGGYFDEKYAPKRFKNQLVY